MYRLKYKTINKTFKNREELITYCYKSERPDLISKAIILRGK